MYTCHVSDGCKGFVVGLGHGVVGVVGKPVVGVLDAVAHATEGFKAVAMVSGGRRIGGEGVEKRERSGPWC